MTDWKKHIKPLYETAKTDPSLVGFIVRDWSITEEAGLKGLCWAMCRDGFVHTNDANFLLELLENHIDNNHKA